MALGPDARTTTSRDGTPIAWETAGTGPPLLLVHGSLGDRTRWEALRPHLEDHRTVHAMDRRGRGDSGDHPDYAIEREAEDVAVVLDAIAADAGQPVAVHASSYGGLCTFGAAGLTDALGPLSLYEAWPPVDPAAFATDPTLLAAVEARIDAGDRDAALELVFREVVHMSDDEVAAYRAAPSWDARVAAVHTFAREERAFATQRFDVDVASRIEVPTLIMTGSESRDWRPEAEAVADAIRGAALVELEGQSHVADVMAPELVAHHLLAFLNEHTS